ncbi:disulfide bond formation protein B [Rickettsiales bacterium LUAb2]
MLNNIQNQHKLHFLANFIGLLLVCFALSFAFYLQINDSKPCPLCYLQRSAFVGIGLGLCLNLTNSIRTSHYGLIVLFSILGLITAGYQTLLHISPDDIGHGSTLFNLHLYTINVIIYLVVIICVTIALFFNKAFNDTAPKYLLITKLLIILFSILILANMLAIAMKKETTFCTIKTIGNNNSC